MSLCPFSLSTYVLSPPHHHNQLTSAVIIPNESAFRIVTKSQAWEKLPLPQAPQSQPLLLLHLKTNKTFMKNHKMPSLSTIICQIPGTTGGHGTMLIYGLLWIYSLCFCSPFPPPSAAAPPLGASSLSRETLNRHMPHKEWVKPICRNLVQCESIWLRATPAPFLLCSFPRRAVRRGTRVSQCTNPGDLCTRTDGKTEPLEGVIWILVVFLFKTQLQSYLPLGFWRKKIIASQHFGTVQILGAFFVFLK